MNEKNIPLWQVLIPWVATAIIIGFAIATANADTPPFGTNEWRKVAFVDEHGQVSCPEVIATVAQQTTNETKILVAEQAARSAASAAQTATNAVKNVVAQMVANDVHIYRLGTLVSFEALINWDPERDILAVCEFSTDSTRTHQHFGYVATQDLGTTKPRVKASDTLAEPVGDWAALPDASVSAVTVHNEEKDYRGVKYSKWYSVEVTDTPDDLHFYVLDMDIDNPDGDGMTLNVVDGFTDGVTGTFVDGSLRKTYKGGILMRCENAE